MRGTVRPQVGGKRAIGNKRAFLIALTIAGECFGNNLIAADLPVPNIAGEAHGSWPKSVQRSLPSLTPVVPPVDLDATPRPRKIEPTPVPKLRGNTERTAPPAKPHVIPQSSHGPAQSAFSDLAFWAALLLLGLAGLVVVRSVQAAFSRKPSPLEAMAYGSIARQRRPSEDELVAALFGTFDGKDGAELARLRERVQNLASEISKLNSTTKGT